MATQEDEEASYVSHGDGSRAPVQVEGGDDESDFRLSQQCSLPHIPRSMVHGRPPIMKHTESSEGQDKGTVQEVYHIVPGDKAASIPEQFYRYPSGEEIDGFIPMVQRKIEEAISRFPSAVGLCITFSNEVGCELTGSISNIHNSSETLCETFSSLGYATCCFQNSHKVEILAAFKALANMTLPESYKAIFLYYTGHGQKYHINTKDGYISINNLKDLLSVDKASNIRDVVKILIFDCCRTNAAVKSVSQTPSVENLIVFYTTPLYQQSFVVDEAGMSVATIELNKLLKRHRSCTLTKLLSVELCREVKRASGGNLRTDFEGSLDHTVDLFEDKMKAMSPREVEITEDDENDVCVINWAEPLHGNHQVLLGYSIVCRPRSQYMQGDNWDILKDDIGPGATSVELPRCDLYHKRLTVVARYSEIDVNAEDYGDCPAVLLKSESISPGEVQLTVTDIGDGILTWSRQVSGDELEHITIQRRQHSTSDEEGGRDHGWVDVTRRVPVEGHSYPFIDRRLGQYDYRMRLHVKGMSSDWVPAQKCDRYSCLKSRLKFYSPYLVLASLLIFTVILFGVSYGAMYGGFTHGVSHPTILAMAGDLIDCDKLVGSLKVFLSAISLTQRATDVVNDNPQGLSMRVASINRTDILKHRRIYNYSRNTNITLNKNYKAFIIPDGYYAYPPYVWADSNISVQVNLSDYVSAPQELTMYLIYGDQNYNSLAEDPYSTPQYEYKYDLLGWDSQTYNMTVRENGYYYIVISVKTTDTIQFSANVNFNYYSVSSDDLDLSQARKLSTVGHKLTIPLDIKDKEIVLCAVDSQADLDAYTIHLQLSYSIRGAVVYTIPLAIFLLPFFVSLFICVKQLLYYCSPRRHYQRIPDGPMNTINS